MSVGSIIGLLKEKHRPMVGSHLIKHDMCFRLQVMSEHLAEEELKLKHLIDDGSSQAGTDAQTHSGEVRHHVWMHAHAEHASAAVTRLLVSERFTSYITIHSSVWVGKIFLNWYFSTARVHLIDQNRQLRHLWCYKNVLKEIVSRFPQKWNTQHYNYFKRIKGCLSQYALL